MGKTSQIFTHYTYSHLFVLFGVVKFCSLRGEGRRGWEGLLKNGVRMKHLITVDYIEFSFYLQLL